MRTISQRKRKTTFEEKEKEAQLTSLDGDLLFRRNSYKRAYPEEEKKME